jgi:acyl-CoA synthetase (AMP-forming)/AMP-acid ligase II
MSGVERVLARARALRAEIEAAPLPASLSVALDEAAERYGDARLCTFFDIGESLTYRQLRERSLALAGVLRRMGVERGNHVAVVLPNVPEFPIAWFAIARLGAVMVPVNTRLTADEVSGLIVDADVTAAVVDHGLTHLVDLAAIRLEDSRVLTVRGDVRATCADPVAVTTEQWPVVDIDDLLSIQYTSGTTGFPKGVMQTHRYWLMVASVARRLLPEPPRRILIDTPFFYMDPQFELLMAMSVGGQTFVAGRASLSRFIDRLREHEIDYSAFWEAAMSLPEREDDANTPLRWTTTTGLAADLHAPLERRFGVIAREWYGMTEIGPGAYVPFDAAEMVGTGSCGIAAPFRELRIVDADGSEVEIGEVGELTVRGPGLFLGYYNRPEANRELISEDGWFRTGDLMRRDQHGFHYYVGRVKDMIRRSHENIAAREVESVLEGIPAVLEAAVIGVPDPMRGEEVKAYLLVDENGSAGQLTPEEVIAHCERHLAEFKIPRYIEFRRDLPRTGSEKVAKGQLRDERDDLRRGSFDRVEGTWR